MHENPLIAYHQKTGKLPAIKISDFLTRSEYHRQGLYQEFYRLMSVEHQMAVGLPSQPPLTVGIALNRKSPDFSERDRVILNLLRSHLIQAYRNAEAFTQLQSHMALVRNLLEKLDEGVVILTQDGKVMLINNRATQWLTDYFGKSSLKNNLLPEALQRWVRHEENLLKQNDDVPPPQKPLFVERGVNRLVVRHLCDPQQCLLLLEEQQTEPSPLALESLGLSHREAEILIWVACGKTNVEIGMILGLSPRTVQKHLEHIFQKLGVETRTAAAAKVHEVASVAGRN